MKFKLTGNQHAEGYTDENGKQHTREHAKGAVIESNTDLCAVHPGKFEKLPEAVTPKVEDAEHDEAMNDEPQPHHKSSSKSKRH